MLLLIDAGNTRVKWALAEEQSPQVRAMRANQAALAELVRARNAAAFEPFAPSFRPKVSGTNPVYDLWLRLTGRGGGELGEAREKRGAHDAL